MLGAVEGLVGVLEKRLRGGLGIPGLEVGQRGDADGNGGHEGGLAAGGKFLAGDGGANTLGDLGGQRLAGIRQQQHEFLAAVARQHVAAA